MLEKKDVVIIGAGPAGMAAAIKLIELGLKNIVILEKENRVGGVLSQCIHDGFGLIQFGKNYSGPEYGQLYEDKLNELGIELVTEATVTSISKNSVTVETSRGTETYEAKAIIVATGCRERGRGAIGIPGTRPAGIYTAGTAQAFINLHNLMVGRKVVIIGSGDIGLIMARRITLEGGRIVCVVEKEHVPGGLTRNIRQCLEDFDIPLYTDSIVTNIYGSGRVSGVDISGSDGTAYYECDTVILSVGLIPEDGMIEGQPEGVFLCGNALYVHDLVDDVSLEGEAAAKAVFEYVTGLENNGIDALEKSRFSIDRVSETRKKRADLLKKKQEAALLNRSFEKRTITCILCPNSCEIDYELKGGLCDKGAAYAKNEIENPRRTLTSSVKVDVGMLPLASVRTTAAIPKSRLQEAMEIIRELSVTAPVKIGQVIIEDFIEKGIELIATKNVSIDTKSID